MSKLTLADLEKVAHSHIQRKAASSGTRKRHTRKKTEFWLNIVIVGKQDGELKVKGQLGGTDLERMCELSIFGDSEQRHFIARIRKTVLRQAKELSPGEECIVGPRVGEYVEGINLVVKRVGEDLPGADVNTRLDVWF